MSQNGPTITLSWTTDPDDDVLGYTLYRSTAETGNKDLLTEDALTETSYIDGKVLPGATYWYWVVAHGRSGLTSSFSAPTSATAQPD